MVGGGAEASPTSKPETLSASILVGASVGRHTYDFMIAFESGGLSIRLTTSGANGTDATSEKLTGEIFKRTCMHALFFRDSFLVSGCLLVAMTHQCFGACMYLVPISG